MPEPNVAPYGSWKSPITSELIVSEAVGLDGVLIDGDDVYWSEGRSTEGGRVVLVRRTADGRADDVTPASYNVRSRVHEYGGGAFLVADGTVYFSNFDDNLVYRQDRNAEPRPISSDSALRYADFALDRGRGRLICA